MTVKDLRDRLANMPDDAELYVYMGQTSAPPHVSGELRVQAEWSEPVLPEQSILGETGKLRSERVFTGTYDIQVGAVR